MLYKFLTAFLLRVFSGKLLLKQLLANNQMFRPYSPSTGMSLFTINTTNLPVLLPPTLPNLPNILAVLLALQSTRVIASLSLYLTLSPHASLHVPNSDLVLLLPYIIFATFSHLMEGSLHTKLFSLLLI